MLYNGTDGGCTIAAVPGSGLCGGSFVLVSFRLLASQVGNAARGLVLGKPLPPAAELSLSQSSSAMPVESRGHFWFVSRLCDFSLLLSA